MPRKQKTGLEIKPGDKKRGNLSMGDKACISDFMGKMTAEQIALKLRRNTKQVQDYINNIKGLEKDARPSLEQQLQTRPEWRRFQKQFSIDEQEEFKHQYVQIMSQLTTSGDIYATEELQVFQVITLKILIDRTLEEQKQALDDMNLSHSELHDLRQNGDTNDPKIADWESLYETSKKTNKECADRYKIYSDKQDKMLHALKSTRDQRIKVWENADKSILGLVRLLIQEDQRDLMGTEAEMMKLASKKEKARLARPHRFDDGTIDQPLLTPETVQEDYDYEEEKNGDTEAEAEAGNESEESV